MKKCLIWGTGIDFNKNFYLIKYYELINKITIVGVTSKDKYYKSFYGYKFIDEELIRTAEFDYLIIMSATTSTVRAIEKEIRNFDIPESKIIPIKAMQLYGFDFDKYIRIKEDVPTIFAPNCWGGILYNSMGLEFNSPLINMFEEHKDYLKFLSNPKYYIEQKLILAEIGYDENSHTQYPIANCGDIKLHFNHYGSFEEANECWNRRKARINWDNIIVMFYYENKQLVDEFLQLHYKNKICFTTVDTSMISHDENNIVSIPYNEELCDRPFWSFVNGTSSGRNYCIDLFELMSNKRIKWINGTSLF